MLGSSNGSLRLYVSISSGDTMMHEFKKSEEGLREFVASSGFSFDSGNVYIRILNLWFLLYPPVHVPDWVNSFVSRPCLVLLKLNMLYFFYYRMWFDKWLLKEHISSEPHNLNLVFCSSFFFSS
uniref:Uncharacterized protein n=1 Tax=Lactuca sativa TaxID=4236 RepID=A0A9R1XTH3_LACSA|nr:hypothetical protein LSAT_V11C100050160 [Lactuca sativa]